MKIAIIGTRGIPNAYGGFEQCAEKLSVGLVKRGHEVVVYSPDHHPYQDNSWNGVTIVHVKDPVKAFGSFSQFIYDLGCIRNLHRHQPDIVLQLGYTSSSIWNKWIPSSAIISTNMDGMEWKRSKYSFITRLFLRYAEKCAISYSDFLISDSKGIQSYLRRQFNRDSSFIAYGANTVEPPSTEILAEFGLVEYKYDMLIARMEPENNIEMILRAVAKADSGRKFLVIGNCNNKFGKRMKERFQSENVLFLNGIYDIDKLNALRFYSNLYFHGHSVGGTNPSLLEAMASSALIAAHANDFNKSILGSDAFYFKSPEEIIPILLGVDRRIQNWEERILNNCTKIAGQYSWDRITDLYERHFLEIIEAREIHEPIMALR